MKKILFPFVMLSLIFISCGKDKEEVIEEKAKTFSFEINQNYIDENPLLDQHVWVSLYNKENVLLFNQKVENGQVHEWDANNFSEEYTLLITKYELLNEHSGVKLLLSLFYTGIGPDIYKIGFPHIGTPTKVGEAIVNIDGFSSANYTSANICSSYIDSETEVSFLPIPIDLYSEPDDLWVLLENGDTSPKYCFLDDINPDQRINLNDNQMSIMSDFVEIEIPDNDGSGIHVESARKMKNNYPVSFKQYDYFTNENSNTIKAFYSSNLFEEFNAQIYILSDHMSKVFGSIKDEVPQVFEPLTASAELDINQNIINVSFSGLADFSYSAFYNYDHSSGINYNVYTYSSVETDFNFIIPNFPQEINDYLSAEINVEDLEHRITAISDWSSYSGYDDFLNNSFRSQEDNYMKKGWFKRNGYYLNNRMNYLSVQNSGFEELDLLWLDK